MGGTGAGAKALVVCVVAAVQDTPCTNKRNVILTKKDNDDTMVQRVQTGTKTIKFLLLSIL
jgi:hypothetical protein